MASNFAGAAALRFFLGVAESVTGAVFVIITSNWWTRQEQAFRAAFWLGGTPVSYAVAKSCALLLTFKIGNFIGGLISYAVGKSKFIIPLPVLETYVNSPQPGGDLEDILSSFWVSELRLLHHTPLFPT